MSDEEVQLSFGEKKGLKADAGMDKNTMVLTDRRLIRLSSGGTSKEIAFISMEDAKVAEVKLTSRGTRPLLRVALLWAGAAAALAVMDFLPIAVALAVVLGLGGSYHLLHYLSVSHEGSILFRTGLEEVQISFQGDMTDQAYTFVNRFFQLKASSSSAPEVSEEEQAWWGTDEDEREIELVTDHPDESPVETLEEGFPQEEPMKSTDEEHKQS